MKTPISSLLILLPAIWTPSLSGQIPLAPQPQEELPWLEMIQQDVVLQPAELELSLRAAIHPEQSRSQMFLHPGWVLVARLVSETRAREGFFGHRNPATDQSVRVEVELQLNVRREGGIGSEIIGGRANAADIEAAWLESPSHRNSYLGGLNEQNLYYGFGARFILPQTETERPTFAFTGHFSSRTATPEFVLGEDRWLYNAYAPDGQLIRRDWDMIQIARNGPRANLMLVRPRGAGWHESSWLGFFHDFENGGWLYHQVAGFLFSPPENRERIYRGEGYWFYHERRQWLWTHPHHFPWVYESSTGHFLFIQENGLAYNWSIGETVDW